MEPPETSDCYHRLQDQSPVLPRQSFDTDQGSIDAPARHSKDYLNMIHAGRASNANAIAIANAIANASNTANTGGSQASSSTYGEWDPSMLQQVYSAAANAVKQQQQQHQHTMNDFSDYRKFATQGAGPAPAPAPAVSTTSTRTTVIRGHDPTPQRSNSQYNNFNKHNALVEPPQSQDQYDKDTYLRVTNDRPITVQSCQSSSDSKTSSKGSSSSSKRHAKENKTNKNKNQQPLPPYSRQSPDPFNRVHALQGNLHKIAITNNNDNNHNDVLTPTSSMISAAESFTGTCSGYKTAASNSRHGRYSTISDNSEHLLQQRQHQQTRYNMSPTSNTNTLTTHGTWTSDEASATNTYNSSTVGGTTTTFSQDEGDDASSHYCKYRHRRPTPLQPTKSGNGKAGILGWFSSKKTAPTTQDQPSPPPRHQPKHNQAQQPQPFQPTIALPPLDQSGHTATPLPPQQQELPPPQQQELPPPSPLEQQQHHEFLMKQNYQQQQLELRKRQEQLEQDLQDEAACNCAGIKPSKNFCILFLMGVALACLILLVLAKFTSSYSAEHGYYDPDSHQGNTVIITDQGRLLTLQVLALALMIVLCFGSLCYWGLALCDPEQRIHLVQCQTARTFDDTVAIAFSHTSLFGNTSTFDGGGSADVEAQHAQQEESSKSQPIAAVQSSDTERSQWGASMSATESYTQEGTESTDGGNLPKNSSSLLSRKGKSNGGGVGNGVISPKVSFADQSLSVGGGSFDGSLGSTLSRASSRSYELSRQVSSRGFGAVPG